MKTDRIVNVIEDLNGRKIVLINDIIFRGKRSIDWEDVEVFLRTYVGEIYEIEESGECIYIGSDLPDEYAHSQYTYKLRGPNARAKANASQGIPELIEIAVQKDYRENKNSKHERDAKYGWYRYVTRFAFPVYDELGEINRFNVFSAILLVRHASSGKKYLYDIIEIKKETGKPCQA